MAVHAVHRDGVLVLSATGECADVLGRMQHLLRHVARDGAAVVLDLRDVSPPRVRTDGGGSSAEHTAPGPCVVVAQGAEVHAAAAAVLTDREVAVATTVQEAVDVVRERLR
ncbi:MAG: hypothetical protein ACLGIG_06865 [Actinomycetes bacterium]